MAYLRWESGVFLFQFSSSPEGKTEVPPPSPNSILKGVGWGVCMQSLGRCQVCRAAGLCRMAGHEVRLISGIRSHVALIQKQVRYQPPPAPPPKEGRTKPFDRLFFC